MVTSDVLALLAIVVSILVFIFTIEHNDNIRFTDAFNIIYSKTFLLRAEVSKITGKYFGGEFYYELDTIKSIKDVEEYILDYLTIMENFFNLIPGHIINKYTLKRLVSLAFYQRVAALYSYLIYRRNEYETSNIFNNYYKAVRMMKKIKKINKSSQKKYNMCYVGIRESDIVFSQDFFKDLICMFTSKPHTESFSIRMNQNINNKEMLPYYNSKIMQMYRNNAQYRFMFYNQLTAYNYSNEIIRKCICLNERELLVLLNNKLFLKKWLSERRIPVITYETFLGKDILFSELCSHFTNTDSFVFQRSQGGGGIGTFYADQVNFSNVLKKIHPLQKYIVSPYINGISVNTHIFVSDKQTVLSPGSIQIIEKKDDQLCYFGCDFIAYRSISKEVKEKIKVLSLQIANYLRKEGYRGIAGIDFIIDKAGKVYCSEINPRFQASTILLDCYFKENHQLLDALEAKSSYELNEMAFSGNIITTLHYETKINYSCYYYYNNNHFPQYFLEKCDILNKAGAKVLLDGMKYYLTKGLVNNDSYMFRAIFSHAICKISPDMTLWISDNVPIVSKPTNPLELKIALLNQGVRLEGDYSQIKRGTYESIDIVIKANDKFENDMIVNCAYQIHLSQYSPFKIVVKNDANILYYYNEQIAEVEPEKDMLQTFSQYNKKILYIATDRLRIKVLSGCENKNMGKGCKFCNVPISEDVFELQAISDALEELKNKEIKFRHILIGGGSCLAPDVWGKIIDICKILKNDSYFCKKPISLMTMLPPIELLPELKNAGIEEVAFNLEVADKDLAQKLMPEKHKHGKISYYEVFRAAVKNFGIGNVRSALLVGLDLEENLYNEILTLADMGVTPCLSAFRALPNSDYEDELGPSNEYLLKVYNNANRLLKERQGDIQELGPKCRACRNNMLIL